MAPLVWLVTGATGGIGLTLVKAIAARGDKVIATGRRAEGRIADVKADNVAVLDLDVTAPRETIAAQVKAAVAIFGRIDVLINNAGMATVASLEEATDKYVETVFGVNVFGTMKVTQAVLPYMREQKSGRIGIVGAGLAWQTLPYIGHYAMTKAALNLYTEALAKEVAPLGIHAVILEVGGVSTDFGAPRDGEDMTAPDTKPSADYEGLWGEMLHNFATDIEVNKPNDINKICRATIDLIKGEGLAKGRKWPVRVAIGPDTTALMRQKCREQMELCDEWEDLADSVIKDDWTGVISPYMMSACSMK